MAQDNLNTGDDLSAVLLVGGPVRGLLLDLWQRTRIDWSFAANRLSDAFRRNRQLSSSSRRLVAETLYGMIRHARRIETALKRAGVPVSGVTDLRRLLAYLVLEAGLEPAVVSAEGPGVDWAAVAGFDDWARGQKRTWQRVAYRYSLPDWIAQRLVTEYGDETALALAASLCERAPMTVRVNRLKVDREELASQLASEGIETRPGAFAPNALHFETRLNLFGLGAFQRGEFEAMDEGSQLIAELVAPPPKGVVLDMCAGAGGKTLALAADMNNRGRIVATDVADRKLTELRRRARRAGVGNVQALAIDGDAQAAWPSAIKKLEGKFERVLIDAPCSGVGSLRRNPEIKWRLTEGDIDVLQKKQLALIDRARSLLAPGGRIIYATCTVLSAENGAVIEGALARSPELAQMPVKNIWGTERAGPLGGGEVLALLPSVHGCDGFFAAVLYKPRS